VNTAWEQKSEHSDGEIELRQLAYDCLEQSKKNFEEAGGYKPEKEDTSSLSEEGEEMNIATDMAPPVQQQAVEKKKANKPVVNIKSDDSGYRTEVYSSETGESVDAGLKGSEE